MKICLYIWFIVYLNYIFHLRRENYNTGVMIMKRITCYFLSHYYFLVVFLHMGLDYIKCPIFRIMTLSSILHARCVGSICIYQTFSNLLAMLVQCRGLIIVCD